MDTQSVLLFISVPLCLWKWLILRSGIYFLPFQGNEQFWSMLIGPCQGLLLLNLYKVCLLSFTISLKNPFKKIRNFNSFFQNTYYVCGSSTKEAYIYFWYVSSPCDIRKHFYVDKNSAIYWLRKVWRYVHLNWYLQAMVIMFSWSASCPMLL